MTEKDIILRFDLGEEKLFDALDLAGSVNPNYCISRQIGVAFAKATDNAILTVIINKAKEEGITDLYILNQDFIVSAIREKAARETPKPLNEWSEDDGSVLWWKFPIEEPPYCGTPLDLGWPGYHTHYTRFVCPEIPKKTREAQND